MNTGKYVFSQLIEFLPKRIFDGIGRVQWGQVDKSDVLLEPIVFDDV